MFLNWKKRKLCEYFWADDPRASSEKKKHQKLWRPEQVFRGVVKLFSFSIPAYSLQWALGHVSIYLRVCVWFRQIENKEIKENQGRGGGVEKKEERIWSSRYPVRDRRFSSVSGHRTK